MKLTSKLLIFGFTAIGAAMFFSGKASAATITVNAFTDDITVNGNCTLREAIQAANTNAAVDACVAGEVTSDTITLGAGTYIMSIAGSGENANATGDFDIDGGIVVIDGAGMGSTTIEGDGVNRIFDISNDAVVTISDLAITNGGATAPEDGAAVGIFGTADVDLTRVNVYGNIGNSSQSIIVQSSGTALDINSSVIRNNSTQGGTVVSSGAQMNINTSYIGENSGVAGEVYVINPSSFSIGNSTIYSNTLSGRAVTFGNAINGTIYSSTIKNTSFTTAPILFPSSVSGQIDIVDTIIDGNYSVSCQDSAGHISNSRNSITSGTCDDLTGTGVFTNADPGIVDTPTLIGGTYVFPPTSPASPVVDSGTNPAPTLFDQTGGTRPQDGNGDGDNFMDIGAYELPQETVAPVITEVTPVPSPSTDTTPTYVFNASEAGYILLSGPCSLISGDVALGDNTVSFLELAPGTYTCGVQMRDYANNLSNILSFTFTITAEPTTTGSPTATPSTVTGTGTSTATTTMTPTGTTLPDTGNSSVLGVIAGTFVVISATTVLVIYKRRLIK